MTKVKVSEASGAVLDWMVAKCEDINTGFPGYWSNSVLRASEDGTENPFAYSTNWHLGGPIIQRERIATQFWISEDSWEALIKGGFFASYGPTPLIAAMRCFVVSKLGNEVEVPEELCV